MTIRVVAVILTVAWTGCASTQQAGRAMYDWEPGTMASYVVEQDQTQTLEIPGQGTQENESKATTDMNLESTAPFTYKLTITDAQQTGGQIPIESLVGLESNLVVDARGTIVSASGLEGNAYIDGMGGAEVFRESLQALFQKLPEEALADGVVWTRSSTIPVQRQGLDLTRKADETYTCRGIQTYEGVRAYQIDVANDMSLTGSGNQGGGDFDFSVQGKVTATTYIDAETGKLLSTEGGGRLAGMISMSQMDLPITLDTTVSVKAQQ